MVLRFIHWMLQLLCQKRTMPCRHLSSLAADTVSTKLAWDKPCTSVAIWGFTTVSRLTMDTPYSHSMV